MKNLLELSGKVAEKASESMHKCATKLFTVSENLKAEEEKRRQVAQTVKEYSERKSEIIAKLFDLESLADIPIDIQEEYEELKIFEKKIDSSNKPLNCSLCNNKNIAKGDVYCNACGNKL